MAVILIALLVFGSGAFIGAGVDRLRAARKHG
jgi:hypothetical protein